MKLTASDLYEFNIIDTIIKEPVGGAEKDLPKVSDNIKKEILKALTELENKKEEELIEERYQKFRKIGNYIQK